MIPMSRKSPFSAGARAICVPPDSTGSTITAQAYATGGCCASSGGMEAAMTRCNWCGCMVDERKADIDGNHLNFYDCIAMLKARVKALTQELIDERVITAQLTDRLEICRICPLADYEEEQISR